jgi:hypothetical protein
MYNFFLGFDNGTTATFGMIGGNNPVFNHIPVKAGLDYNKSSKKNISRIDIDELYEIITSYINPLPNCAFAVIEQPMKNPKRFPQSISGARAFEALLITLENIEIGYDVIDPGKWQKLLLPKGLKGNSEQKQASKDVGIKMFPQFREQIENHGDADGILIAEYCRLTYK